MAFIQNPLGGGYYGQLPNLTEGVQALQRTEIQRRLNDIQQQKQWNHDRQLQDEKLALEALTQQPEDDLRVWQAKEASRQSQQLISETASLYSKMHKEGRPLTGEERVDLITNMNKIKSQIANSRAFTDAYSAAKPKLIEMESKLVGKEKDIFRKRLADFREKLSNPENSKDMTVYDIYSLMEPVEMSAGATIADFIKGQKGQLSPNSYLGAKQYDQEGTISALEQQLKTRPDIIQKMQQDGDIPSVKNAREAAQYIEQSYRPQLSEGMTPGKAPSASDVDEEKGVYQSSDVTLSSGVSGSGYNFSGNKKTEIKLTKEEANKINEKLGTQGTVIGEGSYQAVPTGAAAGKAEFKIKLDKNRRVKLDASSKIQARLQGYDVEAVEETDENGAKKTVYYAVIPNPQEVTVELDYDQHKGELKSVYNIDDKFVTGGSSKKESSSESTKPSFFK